MSETPPKRASKKVFLLLGILILGIVIYAFYQPFAQTITTWVQSPAPEVLTALEPPPAQIPPEIPVSWKMHKFWDIHGVLPGTFERDIDQIRTDEESISQWFELEFQHLGQNYLLFVTKVQSLDREGQVITSPGQMVQIGAALYKKTADNLDLVLVNDQLGEFGSHGELAEISNPSVINIGKNRKAVLLENPYCNQGECVTVGTLIEISPDRLEEVGNFNLSENNSDQCDDSNRAQCYSYTGKLESISDESKDYFDLVLKKSGTELSEDNKIGPAENSLLSYLDDKYEIVK